MKTITAFKNYRFFCPECRKLHNIGSMKKEFKCDMCATEFRLVEG